MMKIPISLLKTAGLLVLVASPQSPTAIVEDVKGSPPGIQVMDYVEPGKVIRLAPQQSIVLGYLRSCWHETIIGGTVTVGAERSDVQDGMVMRSTVACEGSKMQLTAELANKSGAMVLRNVPQDGRREALQRPQFTLYGLSPVVEVRPGGLLTIERLDKPSATYKVDLRSDRLARGAFLDLAHVDVTLEAGGIYLAQAGSDEIVFKIDRNAQPGETPIIGRLLRLQPAN